MPPKVVTIRPLRRANQPIGSSQNDPRPNVYGGSWADRQQPRRMSDLSLRFRIVLQLVVSSPLNLVYCTNWHHACDVFHRCDTLKSFYI